MKFTLDWNCVIEVEEQRAQAASVKALVEAHRQKKIDVALLAASASENTRSRTFPGNAHLFMDRLAKLGWQDLPLVPMPAIIGLCYINYAYIVGNEDEYEAQMDALRAVIAPNVKRNPTDHLIAGQILDDISIQSPLL